MANTVNAFNPRRTAYQSVWGPSGSGFDFGKVNMVKPDLKMVRTPIKRGTTGPVVLDHFFDTIDGTIKISVPDISAATILAICPWATASSNQALVPKVPNATLYQYAQLLNLHPLDKGSDLTEDLNFPKAVPITVFNLDRDGQKETDLVVEFQLYPIQASLFGATPELILAYWGSTAPT